MDADLDDDDAVLAHPQSGRLFADALSDLGDICGLPQPGRLLAQSLSRPFRATERGAGATRLAPVFVCPFRSNTKVTIMNVKNVCYKPYFDKSKEGVNRALANLLVGITSHCLAKNKIQGGQNR